MFIKKETQQLCKDIIENFQDWSQTDYCYRNIKTGVSIWTANGMSSIIFHPEIKAFSFREKLAVHMAIKKSIIQKCCSKVD